MEVNKVLLSIQAGTVYLAPVQEEEDKDELRLFLQDQIDAPDFRQTAYVSVDDVMADAWVSRETCELKLPVAIANIHSELAEGIPMVTGERTTCNKICGSIGYSIKRF